MKVRRRCRARMVLPALKCEIEIKGLQWETGLAPYVQFKHMYVYHVRFSDEKLGCRNCVLFIWIYITTETESVSVELNVVILI